MKKMTILLVLFLSVLSIHAQENPFWDRVNVGVWVGPLFPSGDEADTDNLSTGYYIVLWP